MKDNNLNATDDILKDENRYKIEEIQPSASEIQAKKNTHSNKRANLNKSLGRVTALLLVVLFVFCAFFGGYATSSFFQSEDAAVTEWLVQVLNEEAYFVDYDGLNASFLMENGLKFCLRNDPYCDLMTPEETSAYIDTSNGSSTSFGVTVGQYEGVEGVYVMSVVMGSSAQQEGLQEGMRIISIDGIDFFDKMMDDVSSVLLAKKDNETATLVCLLPSVDKDGNAYYDIDGETFTATILKHEYTPIVVECFDNKTAGLEGLTDETAYIKVTSFVGKTAEQFDEAMNWYKSNGKSNLILDLRNNPGGSEENMQVVGSYLLKSTEEGKNPLIITIKDKYENVTEIRAKNSFYDDMNFENVIVLVNNMSASASEAILTAMIDYETVDIIIGEKTFGKGTGLTTAYMPIYGYGVTFTSTYYFSPDGNSHDQVGLEPTNGYSMVDTNAYPYSYEGDEILQRAINAMI